MNLIELGWTPFFSNQLSEADAGLLPARVVEERRNSYLLCNEAGDAHATLSGRLRHLAADASELPGVGDWVLARDGVIRRVLARRTAFTRRAAGTETRPQLVAANVDRLLVVTSLNLDLNARRLERYLALAWEGGAEPAVVLTKADLCPDPFAALARIERAAPGCPVHAVSALDGSGIEELTPYLEPGRTLALVGSSGAGKSTLLNRLAGAELAPTSEIRAGDDRGRHTTTARSLFALPSGALVIDTPGMRELQLWEADAGLERAFAEIPDLARACRFRDCAHASEPGCAVRASVEPERLRSWEALQREAAYVERKALKRARAERRRESPGRRDNR